MKRNSYLSKNRKMKRRLFKGLFWILLILLCVIACFPLFWMLMTSLKHKVDAFAIPPVWIFKPNLEAYKVLFVEKDSFRFLLNSVIIAFSATFVSMLIGTLAAYSLARFKFAGREDFAFWFLVNRMMPPLAIIIPIYMLFLRWKLLDTRTGLIFLYTAMQLPFVIWMMRGFFEDLPRELEETAMIDGASWFGAFTRITLPLTTPGLTATAIFSLILSWNEFAFAFVITGRNAKTLPPSALTFMTEAQVTWNEVGAAAIVISLPMILFAMAVQKHLVRGLTMGAIKE